MLNRCAVKLRRIDTNNHPFKFSGEHGLPTCWFRLPSRNRLLQAKLSERSCLSVRSVINLAPDQCDPRNEISLPEIRAIRAISG